jgi:hypothetical protein
MADAARHDDPALAAQVDRDGGVHAGPVQLDDLVPDPVDVRGPQADLARIDLFLRVDDDDRVEISRHFAQAQDPLANESHRTLEAVAGHPHPAFHQHPRAAAHDDLVDFPLAAGLAGRRADFQVPDGCPKVTTLRSPPPAARFTSVPGIAAAVPMATAAVPIIAWCSLPIDSARTFRSIESALIGLPLDDV